MVFEQLFGVRWITRKEHAFILGLSYTLIGLVSAGLVFPENVGLTSIAFTSILLIPSLNALLKLEENAEVREKKLSLRLLFRDHRDVFKVYLFMFLGIFLAYSLVALIVPDYAISRLFSVQLKTAGISGMAISGAGLGTIIMNNLIVLLVCFVLSLVYGAGSVLFLVWNASVWGVVFAYFAGISHNGRTGNMFVDFSLSILPFLPHMLTEALAYISAAITGGIVSKAVIREKLFSARFKHIMTDAFIFLGIAFILVLVAGLIEVKFFLVVHA